MTSLLASELALGYRRDNLTRTNTLKSRAICRGSADLANGVQQTCCFAVSRVDVLFVEWSLYKTSILKKSSIKGSLSRLFLSPGRCQDQGTVRPVALNPEDEDVTSEYCTWRGNPGGGGFDTQSHEQFLSLLIYIIFLISLAGVVSVSVCSSARKLYRWCQFCS